MLLARDVVRGTNIADAFLKNTELSGFGERSPTVAKCVCDRFGQYLSKAKVGSPPCTLFAWFINEK